MHTTMVDDVTHGRRPQTALCKHFHHQVWLFVGYQVYMCMYLRLFRRWSELAGWSASFLLLFLVRGYISYIRVYRMYNIYERTSSPCIAAVSVRHCTYIHGAWFFDFLHRVALPARFFLSRLSMRCCVLCCMYVLVCFFVSGVYRVYIYM